MIDFRIEYDDGVPTKRKGDYDKRISRHDRENGYYLIVTKAEHKINIGYLRLSEIPALEALLKTFVEANTPTEKEPTCRETSILNLIRQFIQSLWNRRSHRQP